MRIYGLGATLCAVGTGVSVSRNLPRRPEQSALAGFSYARKANRRVIILGVVLIVLGYLLLIPVLITIGWILAGIGLVLLLIAVIGHREIGGRRYWF